MRANFLNYFNIILENNVYKFYRKNIYRYPVPVNINYLWNFGSLAALCLIIQIITGVCLAMSYTPHIDYAFNSIEHIMREVQYGWLLRYVHFNGASFFFLIVYIHLFRGIYYGSFSYPRRIVWFLGMIMLVVMIATAFLGYVLPWGQMSFWAAVVITNLFSAFPIIGGDLVQWLWGGYTIGNPTLNRFFSLHYLLPFILVALSVLHLVFLQISHSNNPLGIKSKYDYIPFHPYFIIKDLLGFFLFFILFSVIIFFFPNLLGHPDNYIYANSLSTPHHIVPEWYFLPLYAVLRCIPDKLGGVLILIVFIFSFFFLGTSSVNLVRIIKFRQSKCIFWFFVVTLLMLGYLGACALSEPFITVSRIFTVVFFVIITFLFDSGDRLSIHSV